jgi:hypothetical protein
MLLTSSTLQNSSAAKGKPPQCNWAEAGHQHGGLGWAATLKRPEIRLIPHVMI